MSSESPVRKLRYLVPNFFTALSFSAGFLAILLMVQSMSGGGTSLPFVTPERPPMMVAAWLVVWCALFDKLDGLSARVLNASSAFGAQFDSMADLVSFGLTPGVLCFLYAQKTDPVWFRQNTVVLTASVLLYVLCTACRLARYNAVDAGSLKDYFRGLASTFAGSVVALSVILLDRYQVSARLPGSLSVIPLALVATGLLMVSPFYLPKLAKRKSAALNVFQGLNVVAGYVCTFGMIWPEYLYGALMLYAFVGFAHGLTVSESQASYPKSSPTEPPPPSEPPAPAGEPASLQAEGEFLVGGSNAAPHAPGEVVAELLDVTSTT